MLGHLNVAFLLSCYNSGAKNQEQHAQSLGSILGSTLAELVVSASRDTTSKNSASAGAMEVLQSKITLQLDLISRNEEEMDLAKTEAVTAAANLGRQLQRIRRKLEVRAC